MENGQWNGLSELLDVASENGITIDTPARLDVGELRPNDALLIIFPGDELPRSSLSAFLRAGGRVAIADDFGSAHGFLQSYGIERMPASPGGPQLRGNPNLPIALPRLGHPLVSGVSALVTNHPTVVQHAELEPVLTFEEATSGGLVLTGAIEEGRLVVIADPSVLINNMLRFRGNRRFAGNLLAYLERSGSGPAGRVMLITPDVELTGLQSTGATDPVQRLRSWLDDLAHRHVPPVALTLLSVVLVAILAVFAVSSLPLRSPYDARSLRPPHNMGGGFAGRVRYFSEPRRHLVHPLMVYKFELEGELVRRLRLQQQPVLRDVVDAMKQQGAPSSAIADARSLLVELAEMREKIDRPPGTPRVSRRRLRELVARGERVLDSIPAEVRS